MRRLIESVQVKSPPRRDKSVHRTVFHLQLQVNLFRGRDRQRYCDHQRENRADDQGDTDNRFELRITDSPEHLWLNIEQVGGGVCVVVAHTGASSLRCDVLRAQNGNCQKNPDLIRAQTDLLTIYSANHPERWHCDARYDDTCDAKWG